MSFDAPRLEDLKRIRHVGRARHAGQVALDFGIGGQPVLGVLLLPGQRLRLVGNLIPLDDAQPARDAERRAERRSADPGAPGE